MRAGGKAEMLGDRFTDVGEGGAQSDVATAQAWPKTDNRNALACVIRALP